MRAKIEGQFAPSPRDLVESPAWCEALLHPYIMSLLNSLIREHLHHGGKENGNLVAPYSQLQSYGDGGGRIRTPEIRPTIDRTLRLGLIRVTPGGHRRGPSRYALTWLPTYDGEKPSRDYLAVAPETIRAIAEGRKQKQRRSTSWTKETAPPRWQRRTANSKSKQAVSASADSKSILIAPPASQSDSANGKSIGVLTCANGKSIPHSASSKCYLESLNQGGDRLEGKEIGRIEVRDEVQAASPCSVPGAATVIDAMEPATMKGDSLDAPPDLTPGKASYSRCAFRIATPLGDRICGMLAPAGYDLCVDHAFSRSA
jgi:hypothetical protein